jgi:hypothetical protein
MIICAMCQKVSRLSFTSEARVGCRTSFCEVCVGKSDSWTSLSSSTLVLLCQFLSANIS